MEIVSVLATADGQIVNKILPVRLKVNDNKLRVNLVQQKLPVIQLASTNPYCCRKPPRPVHYGVRKEWRLRSQFKHLYFWPKEGRQSEASCSASTCKERMSLHSSTVCLTTLLLHKSIGPSSVARLFTGILRPER